MSRLTDDKIYTFDNHLDKCESAWVVKVQKRLKEYEDAEEQGLLLRLPCKVGDIVYVIVMVLDYGEIGDKATKTYYITERKFELYMLSDYGKYVFGKTVFLTKEEAEQKLAEIRGDNNGKM
jgi:hypothetical protein